MKKKQGVQRNIGVMVQRLINHLEILIDFADKSFYEYQHEKYLGEVAGKLRVLVVETRTNKPLLLGLMDHFHYEREWDGTLPNSKFTLRTYMYMLAIYSKDHCTFSNEKIIRYLSQQSGGSHEDWELDSELHYLLYEDRTKSCDSPYINRLIRSYVNIVLREATLFLWHLHQKGILKKLGIKYKIRELINLYTFYDNSMDWNLVSREKKAITDMIKPVKGPLHHYDILYLSGRTDSFSFQVTGLTEKDKFKKNGPKSDFWMEQKHGIYTMKNSG